MATPRRLIDIVRESQARRSEPAPPRRRLIDISHTIEHGMVTYRGLPGPRIADHLTRAESRGTYAPGTEFCIGAIHMVGNTGTYVDSPFHRYADGKDLADLPLASLANLDCVVARVDTSRDPRITRLPLTPDDVRGRAVLVHTGWDRYWRTERYFDGHPHLAGNVATWLVEAGAVLVGIDSLNIDGTDTKERPVHSTLLAHDVPIVEHLCNLGDVPDHGGRFFAVPVKVRGFASFPVRAFVLA
jgi:arylformamidase